MFGAKPDDEPGAGASRRSPEKHRFSENLGTLTPGGKQRMVRVVFVLQAVDAPAMLAADVLLGAEPPDAAAEAAEVKARIDTSPAEDRVMTPDATPSKH